MSESKVRFKKDAPMKKLSLNEISNLLLNSGNRWFPMSIIYGKSPVFIIGSYVYKHLIRGEQVADVDALCDNSKDLSSQIKLTEKTAYNPDLPKSYRLLSTDYNVIKFTGDDKVKVDLIGIPDFISRVNYTGLSLSNSLVLTTEGIRHIFEVPELSKALHLETDNPETEREWVIKNLKEGSYCKWDGMREKDKKYFKDWKVIDFQECQDHGIFNTKN